MWFEQLGDTCEINQTREWRMEEKGKEEGERAKMKSCEKEGEDIMG